MLAVTVLSHDMCKYLVTMFQKHKEMRGLYTTLTDMRNVYKIFVGVLGRPVFINVNLDVRVILKWVVKIWVVMLWIIFTWLETGCSVNDTSGLYTRRRLSWPTEWEWLCFIKSVIYVEENHDTVTFPLLPCFLFIFINPLGIVRDTTFLVGSH